MELYTYQPKGTCSKKMIFEIDDNTIHKCEIIGGCQGNLIGISRLLVGMDIDGIIKSFDGVSCGLRKTSCPDQIAVALRAYKEKRQRV